MLFDEVNDEKRLLGDGDDNGSGAGDGDGEVGEMMKDNDRKDQRRNEATVEGEENPVTDEENSSTNNDDDDDDEGEKNNTGTEKVMMTKDEIVKDGDNLVNPMNQEPLSYDDRHLLLRHFKNRNINIENNNKNKNDETMMVLANSPDVVSSEPSGPPPAAFLRNDTADETMIRNMEILPPDEEEKKELQIGDHVYQWRSLFGIPGVFQHHGIVMDIIYYDDDDDDSTDDNTDDKTSKDQVNENDENSEKVTEQEGGASNIESDARDSSNKKVTTTTTTKTKTTTTQSSDNKKRKKKLIIADFSNVPPSAKTKRRQSILPKQVKSNTRQSQESSSPSTSKDQQPSDDQQIQEQVTQEETSEIPATSPAKKEVELTVSPVSKQQPQQSNQKKEKRRSGLTQEGIFRTYTDTDKWHKVTYEAPWWKRQLYRAGTCTGSKSDAVGLVLARVHFIVQHPELLPDYHVLHANCECVAFWCKTGTWSTLQASTFLEMTAAGQVKSSTTLATIAANAQVTVPSTGLWGWLGYTTQVSFVSLHPMVVPALCGYAVITIGVPALVYAQAKKQWSVTTKQLCDAFWESAMKQPDVFAECMTHWSSKQ